MYPHVLRKNKKNIKNFLLKLFNFYNLRKICTITWACFCNAFHSASKLLRKPWLHPYMMEKMLNGTFRKKIEPVREKTNNLSF